MAYKCCKPKQWCLGLNQKGKQMKFVKSYGGRDKYYSTKYKKDMAKDCVIRAIVHATNIDYMQVFKRLTEISLETGFYPNDRRTYGVYLKELGWVKRKPMRKSNGRLYRLKEIKCDRDLIVHTRRHLTYVNGDNFDMTLYDTWNCSYKIANSYWENVGDYK